MEFKLSSGNYDIVGCGEAFLFGNCSNFVIEVDKSDGSNFHFFVVINFITDKSYDGHKIISTSKDEVIRLNFINYNQKEGRILNPVAVASIDNKELYVMLGISYDFESEMRSIKYTFFYEKEKEMRND